MKKISIILLLSLSIATVTHEDCCKHYRSDKLGSNPFELVSKPCLCDCLHYRSQIIGLKYTDPCTGCGHALLLKETE